MGIVYRNGVHDDLGAETPPFREGRMSTHIFLLRMTPAGGTTLGSDTNGTKYELLTPSNELVVRHTWMCRSFLYRAAGSFEGVMIVTADFPDHWKTDLLVELSGSESAVRCLLRFWAHCQNRKRWRFTDLTPPILAGICKWKGDPKVWWSAMTQTFLKVEQGGTIVAHDWEVVNASLIGRWKGGETNRKKFMQQNRGKRELSSSSDGAIGEDGIGGTEAFERKVLKPGQTGMEHLPEIPF